MMSEKIRRKWIVGNGEKMHDIISIVLVKGEMK